MKLTSLPPVRPSLGWRSLDLQSMDKANGQLRSTHSTNHEYLRALRAS